MWLNAISILNDQLPLMHCVHVNLRFTWSSVTCVEAIIGYCIVDDVNITFNTVNLILT